MIDATKSVSWSDIERDSGLSKDMIAQAGRMLASSTATIMLGHGVNATQKRRSRHTGSR